MCFFFNFNIACTFDDAFDFDVNRSLSGFLKQISSTKLYNRILCVFPLIYWFLLGFWTYINQILELISLWFKCLFCMENETKKNRIGKILISTKFIWKNRRMLRLCLKRNGRFLCPQLKNRKLVIHLNVMNVRYWNYFQFLT